ncbi:large subunit ribosomal protein L29 [Dysgonomonas sp. PFB1-18]|uniref:50S ribosomal protein L29 n=1 Tax=unclassified Dysgonomonas TaxID=2630389 RepID=UPI0024755F82|nr:MULTISPECIES: 50S ribosomal protein L29 [unclassified Dysgonomonas]MDH6307309.1 large subunit ribosomal protein L29 [Dysgonomonas sp. PF1-14]MDH6337227.1 large subunit ribosomal protein L29 [Dysgonomonas sp. PF1-16]MDH6379151.1 large subunit ribosomal protein L29 [Dysgonomonas sp. PFB1-18]MDH6396211.1 large subunit ribosomal protein L29 [Dysgonomonas sp. PF1-23]
MKIAEVRELSDKELKERLDAERIALNQLVLNHSVSPLDNPTKIKEKRRDIARFLTELRQRELKNK